jgi:two-component system, chemotaxis family, chemotaxis protein CheY
VHYSGLTTITCEPRSGGSCAMDYSGPVLVVNDVASMTDIIVSLLKKIGFADIDTAENGAAALKKLAEKPYDLVISDWKMEPVDGQKLLETVRAIPKIARTPFIMVTAHIDLKHVIAATQVGVDGYITIPFSLSTLKSKITEIFDSVRVQALE